LRLEPFCACGRELLPLRRRAKGALASAGRQGQIVVLVNPRKTLSGKVLSNQSSNAGRNKDRCAVVADGKCEHTRYFQ